MEVDDEIPIASTQQPAAPAEAEVAPPSPPPPVESAIPPSTQPQPPSSQPEPSQPAEEVPSPAEATPTLVVDDSQPEIVAIDEVSETATVSAAAADTTTAVIVIDTESQETIDASSEAPSQSRQDEPIELISSPSSDVDANTQQVTTNAKMSQSDAIVDLDTSSNEADDVKEVTDSTSDILCSQRPPQPQSQQPAEDLDTLDLELINSDSSSHSENEVQIADISPPSPPLTQSVPDAPSQPTSTVQSDVVEIDIDANDASTEVAAINADQTNNVHEVADAAPTAEDSVVESTNQQNPIEIPENICTITGE